MLQNTFGENHVENSPKSVFYNIPLFIVEFCRRMGFPTDRDGKTAPLRKLFFDRSVQNKFHGLDSRKDLYYNGESSVSVQSTALFL